MEAILFRGALMRILKKVLTVDPRLGPVYLSKVDLADTYMSLWVRMEDVPSVDFLIPKNTPSNTQLMRFHLFLPIGYIDSAPYFCMAKETVANLANEAISQKEQTYVHPLNMEAKYRAANDAGVLEAQADASWGNLPEEHRFAAKANVDFYPDDFISGVQGGPRERRQMLWHLFHQINRVFRPNKEADTNRKDPISLKNMGQGDGSWSTQKTFLRWDLDTIYNLLRLTPR